MIARLLEESSSENEKKEDKSLTLEETLDNKDKITEKDIEDSLDEELDSDFETTNIQYSFDEEQFLMEQFYSKEHVKYEQSLYKQIGSSRFESEEEYTIKENEFHYTEAEILTTEEAEEALIEMQYAAVIGNSNDINSEKKRKFDMWIKFNSALFKLFESSYALTRDVDYKPLA